MKRTLALGLVLSLPIAVAVGCGGAPAASQAPLQLRTEIHVVRGEVRERLGIAPEQARIQAAAAVLEKAIGHPVAIEVDAALTPASNSGLETQTANSIEGLARFFSDSAKRDPLRHAFVQKHLQRISARYRASTDSNDATFEDANGTLAFTMREAHWNGGWLPSGHELDSALGDALQRSLAARFAGRGDGTLSEEDHAAYFRFVTSRRGDRSKSESDQDRGERALALLRFEARVRGKPIHASVEKSLADDAPWLLESPRMANSPAPAELRGAYARWIEARFFAMEARPRDALYERLFRRGECPADPCPTLPELDRTRLALGFFDRAAPSDEREFGAFDQAVCLHEERNGKLERSRSCNSVYELLTDNVARAEHLVAALVRLKRRDLLLAALANARKQMPVLLDALERKGGPLYLTALRALLDIDDYRFRDQSYVLRAEVTRMWPKRADVRPTLLRVLVEDYAKSGRQDDAFEKLASEFAPLDAALFARFLDEGPRAVELAPIMWASLKNVAKPFEIVAPRLDGYVATRGLDAAKTVSGLVRRACASKDLEGLRVIRVVLQNRVKAGDQDSVALALAARDCKAAPPP